MTGVTCCHDCGSPVQAVAIEDISQADGYYGEIYLCRECADKRDGIPPMDEQVMESDGEGRR